MTLKEYFTALKAAVVLAKTELDRATAALQQADDELAAMCPGPPPEPEPENAVD